MQRIETVFQRWFAIAVYVATYAYLSDFAVEELRWTIETLLLVAMLNTAIASILLVVRPSSRSMVWWEYLLPVAVPFTLLIAGLTRHYLGDAFSASTSTAGARDVVETGVLLSVLLLNNIRCWRGVRLAK